MKIVPQISTKNIVEPVDVISNIDNIYYRVDGFYSDANALMCKLIPISTIRTTQTHIIELPVVFELSSGVQCNLQLVTHTPHGVVSQISS